MKKTKSAKFNFAFSYKNDIFGVWCDYLNGYMFISYDYYKNAQIYATTIENHMPNTLLINSAKNYNCWKKLLNNYKLGNVYFENQKIKNQAMEVIKMFLR